MAFLHDSVLDAGLAIVANIDQVFICSQEPANETEAESTYALGGKTSGISVGSAGDATPNGRKRTIGAITGGSVTGTGTASHWAGIDNGTNLIAANSLSSSQGVTNGNTFSLAAIDIRIPDAA